MAEAVVSVAVERISGLLIEEAKFLGGVRVQVEDLQTELKRMQSFLRDADNIHYRDNRVRNWIGEIRELAYKAENVLDAYVLKVASRSGRYGGLRNMLRRFVCIFGEGKNLHKVGLEICEIKEKIANLTASLDTYGVNRLRESEGSNSVHNIQSLLRRTYSHYIEEDFVGFQEDICKLVAELMRDDNQCRVVSICGMGGLGKTTLARKVYHHQTVRHHFDRFGWTTISQQWSKEDVLQRLLNDLIPEKKEVIKSMRDEELVRQLFEIQNNSKCLVVVDDVWSTEVWEIIKHAFPSGKAGSKILLTSRFRNVAECIDPFGIIHEPPFFDDKDSWELLCKKAFPRSSKDPDSQIDAKMEELGMKMARQCGGLPLAIVVLGGLLAKKKKDTLIEWQKVYENVDSHIMNEGKLCAGGQEGRILGVLSLSYHELPYQLKTCFLYLGHYPEDFDIEVEKLCQLWIAEGFVLESKQHQKTREEETSMDVAICYLSELAQRYMVQVTPEEDYPTLTTRTRFTTCRLHDLVRDLCLRKAKEENFVEINDYRRSNQHVQSSFYSMDASSTSSSGSTAIHRLINYLDHDTNINHLGPEERIQGTRMIQFLFFNGRSQLHVIHLCMDLKFLRVLDLENVKCGYLGQQVLPKEIGNLILLRYLGLRNTYFIKLPSSMGNLRYLQTLDLRTIVKTIVPNVLWKMEGLMHLYLPYSVLLRTEGKLRIDSLRKLETLENFNSDKVDAKGLLKLSNLRVLSTAYLNGTLDDNLAVINDYLFHCKHRLQFASFKVQIDDSCKDERISHLRKFVTYDRLGDLEIQGTIVVKPLDYLLSPSLENLINLSLIDSLLEDDPMPTLEMLPNLRSLVLCNVFVGKEIVCSIDGFPHLQSLILRHMCNLEEWRVEEGAMPNLSVLLINSCKELKKLPDGLKFISNLKSLLIFCMPRAFQDRVRVVHDNEGEDFHIVQHIHSIEFHG